MSAPTADSGSGSPGGIGGLLRHMRMRSAAALVVANMIGAGIFTTTGFQAEDLGHPGLILVLWVVGGVLALLGALCYAELGAMMPEAGAEYVYLRETFGPALGFMSAVVSLVAGFSAAIAAAAKSFILYLGHFFPVFTANPDLAGIVPVVDVAALGLVWLLVVIHMTAVRVGTGFNDLVTLLKVVGITVILLGAVAVGTGDVSNLTVVTPAYESMDGGGILAAMGTSLVFVMFCYSGWNAAAYVAGEMEDPQRDLPRALLIGTATVLVLYLGLNLVYFYGATATELAGRVEVGLVASRTLFGPWGVTLVTIVLATSILASASAMTVAGPRVYYALGTDFDLFAFLAKTRESGAPLSALLLQGVATSVIILLGAVDQIQQYAGFTLVLFSALAVSCVIVLRIRHPDMERPFRAWGYPVTPIVFLILSAWMMFWAIQGRPVESVLSLLTVVGAGLIFSIFLRDRRAGGADEGE